MSTRQEGCSALDSNTPSGIKKIRNSLDDSARLKVLEQKSSSGRFPEKCMQTSMHENFGSKRPAQVETHPQTQGDCNTSIILAIAPARIETKSLNHSCSYAYFPSLHPLIFAFQFTTPKLYIKLKS